MLKNRPEYCAPYTMVKEEMGMPETSCRKLFKSLEFQRCGVEGVDASLSCVLLG